MKNTRTNNSIKNSIASLVVYILNILMTFLMQSVFIRNLGAEYNGVKGLFTNILSMLSIAELGFGSAIVYNLYRPMAEKKEDEIKTLVNFYKNVYHIVAGVTLAIGIVLLPVVPYIVGEVSIPENIKLLFMLYLLNTVASYLLTYKRSVLYADQKNYVTNIVSSIMIVLKNIVQILIICLTKNFILFLICQIAFTILENIIINNIVRARYKYIIDMKNLPVNNAQRNL